MTTACPFYQVWLKNSKIGGMESTEHKLTLLLFFDNLSSYLKMVVSNGCHVPEMSF
ncbi:MAG: hypothetical protein ACFFA6_15390 [Promethearchaeota archaeon]